MAETAERFASKEKYISTNTVRQIGERSLWGAGIPKAELGVNDPLTHLQQYIEHGEMAIPSIDEDLITDIAERQLKPTFVNSVKFDRSGWDFISRENKFSMRAMTAITEEKFAGNVVNMDLYQRAKIESKEVDRLNQWFDLAQINDVFVVESLPLTPEERYTIVRAHQKVSSTELIEHVITLHNGSVDIFNRHHRALGVTVADSQNALELLDNMYTYRPAHDFVKEYVSTYDELLSDRYNEKFSYGLRVSEKAVGENDISAIRKQTALRSVYLDNLRAIYKSGGYVTPEIIKINHEVNGGLYLEEGGAISFAVARELMNRSLQSVVATFNLAPQTVLNQLANSNDRVSAGAAAGHYGGEAKAAGIHYGGACPTGSNAAASQESGTLAQAYRLNKDPSQCGTCPKCLKEYYVPKKLYDKKILHCGNCKSAIHFDGRSLNEKEINEIYGVEQKKFSPIDIFIASFKKIGHKVRLDRLLKQQSVTADEFSQKRYQKLIQKEQAEIIKLSQVT